MIRGLSISSGLRAAAIVAALIAPARALEVDGLVVLDADIAQVNPVNVEVDDAGIELVEEAAPAANVNFARPVMNDQVFDQWVFNTVGNAQQARSRFDAMLTVQVETVERVCGLTPPQKQKLLLAARGDIVRFFDRVEESRKKFDKVKNDQNRWGEVFQDIQPLQLALNSGLFNESSLFYKVVQQTLSEDQRANYDRSERERRMYQYRSKIELAVTALDESVAMSAAQRAELTRLLLATPTPKSFGQYDIYVVLYRISKLPAAKLDELFPGPQRRALDRQLDQARGLEHFLKQQGLLSDEEPAAGPRPQRARADVKRAAMRQRPPAREVTRTGK